jgi:hypothetical protein
MAPDQMLDFETGNSCLVPKGISMDGDDGDKAEIPAA